MNNVHLFIIPQILLQTSSTQHDSACFITMQTDSCNSFAVGLPDKALKCLHRVQNAATAVWVLKHVRLSQ